MKLTPLLLFLLLLVVLVIATITLKNPIASEKTEAFVQYKTNVVPQSETSIAPYSSRNVVKLYDNLFIDRQNMNIVEVVGSAYTETINVRGNVIGNVVGNVDSTGSSITQINVKTRDGASKNYQVSGTANVETDESKISGINATMGSVSMYSSICTDTARYQLFYIPWMTDTYIHGIQLTTHNASDSQVVPLHVVSSYIPSDQKANIVSTYYVSNNTINITPPTTTIDSSQKNKLVIEPLYSPTRTVYQLIPGVKYDIQSGNLIISSYKSITVYDRSGNPKTFSSAPSNTEIPQTLPTTSSGSWIVHNTDTNAEIVYIPSPGKTLVLVFQKVNSGSYSIISMGRFDQNKELTSGNTIGSKIPPATDASEYYKWYWYWNMTGNGSNPKYSDNYMLKTQIVPPVCPACPSMSCAKTTGSVDNSSTSTTTYASANSTSKVADTTNKPVDTNSNLLTSGASGTADLLKSGASGTADLLKSGASGTADLLKSGASGTTDLLKSGASGTTDLLKSGASGTTDLLKSGVSGTADLLKSGVSGTADLLKSGVSGTADLLKSGASGTSGDSTNRGSGGYYGGLNTPYGSNSGYNAPGFSRGNPPTDNYSYYGALPQKGSSYIPITADFSAFKK